MKRMMMISGVLALVAAALIVFLVVDKPEPKSPEEEWRPGKLLNEGAKIIKISVTTDGKSINLVYKPEFDAYVLVVEGKEYLADSIMVDRLIGVVKELKREKLIDLDPPDLTIYGLKPPMLEIKIEFENDAPLELEVGKENYTRDALFAKVKSEPTVFLIPLDMNTFFGMKTKTFRSRTLMLTAPTNIASIEIKVYDPEMLTRMEGALLPKLVVQKQTTDRPQWVIVSPILEDATFKKVDNFFQRLRINDVMDVIDADPADLPKYGLDKPRAAIILTLLSGHEQKILFGREEEDGRVYIMNSDRNDVMVIPKSYMIELLLFSGRRETTISERREMLPTRIMVEYPRSGMPTMQLDLLPDGRTYAIQGKPELTVRLARARKLIKALWAFEGSFVYHQEPYPREKFGLDRPWMHVQVIEGDTIPIDVALGDTVSTDQGVMTFIEDLKRKCVLMISGNIREKIPYDEREFTAPPRKREE